MPRIEDVHEIQNLELSLLKSVADFCEAHDLRYYMVGGTLLGAVRHQGYIPWDDDIDLAMPRPDYDRFLESYSDGPYKILHIGNCSSYAYPFAKVVDTRTVLTENGSVRIDCQEMGLNIDVYPMDGVKDLSEDTQKKVRKRSVYAHRLGFALPPKKGASIRDVLKRWFWVLRFAVPGRKWYYSRLNRQLRRTPFDTSDYVTSPFGRRCEKEIVPAPAFSEYVLLPFEREVFRAPAGYDLYLKQMYGDYMQLPPPEQRVANHSTKIFWRKDAES